MIRGGFKKIALLVLFGVIAVNFILFLKRQIFSASCDLDTLLKDRAVTLSSDNTEVLEEATSCVVGDPCRYLDVVDLRIIVLTFKRWQSLTKLLNSLNDLLVDNDRVALEIWVDRAADSGRVDEKTLLTAKSFQWKNGQVRVHIQTKHAGIFGQWIDTWKPHANSSDEIALILEDDMSISPYSYRWLKAARKFFNSRTDVAGITLQSEGLILANSGATFRPSHSNGVAFMYSLMGSWGFAPTPYHWLQFQNWYHEVVKDPNFNPYVEGIVMNQWFKHFQKAKKSHTMWTMWFIYYCHAHHLYTVYNNLNAYQNTTKNCLAVNRREPGLHYSGKAIDNTGSLLRIWKDEFVHFNQEMTAYSYSGKASILHIDSSKSG